MKLFKTSSFSGIVIWLVIILLMAVLVWSIISNTMPDNEIFSSLMKGVFGLMTVYLGADLGAMVKGTVQSKGDPVMIEPTKYLSMILALALCTILTFICWIRTGADIKADVVTMINWVIGLAGIYVGGIKANKIATKSTGDGSGAKEG
jgi:drug/metabolite transporter (DMT)-like permease